MNRFLGLPTLAVTALIALLLMPSMASAATDMDECILRVIETARDSATIG